MQKLKITIVGTTPLLMHNIRGVNPLMPEVKKLKLIDSKKFKTDDDHYEIAKLSFLISSYYDKAIGWYLPANMVEGSIRNGAKSIGKDTLCPIAIKIDSEKIPLVIDNKKSPEELFEYDEYVDTRSVTIANKFNDTTKSRLLRTRPRFNRWSLIFNLKLDNKLLSVDDFLQALHYAGIHACLGDFRPRYGSFTAKVEEVK
jgi:hypothetical protein